ncbi:MAG TPA: ATP-binding protein, partial [Pseudomonadales bacterium]|nr:ATP-binding protein [Pseudomonadales bacterium]
EDVDLISMLKNIYSELELSVKDANVKVVLNIADNFPSTIICDKVRIKQAIYNLTSNALKFTQRGQITISAESLVSDVATHPSLIRISVSDTGIGIKPDDLSQVFSEFYQVKGKKSRRGTGLGLTISKKLIDLMGGDLTACSTFGEGSEFIITLPFTPAASQTTKAQPLSLENTIFDEHTLSDFRLVIVDDVPTNVLVAEAILHRYGAHVSSFIDPQEALAYVLNNPNTIDAIVTDYNMPEMTGLELAHRIHAAPGFEDLKIFALSGAIDKDLEALTGEGSPITACLSKPLEIRELVGVLLSYQHSPRTPREVGQAESV